MCHKTIKFDLSAELKSDCYLLYKFTAHFFHLFLLHFAEDEEGFDKDFIQSQQLWAETAALTGWEIWIWMVAAGVHFDQQGRKTQAGDTSNNWPSVSYQQPGWMQPNVPAFEITLNPKSIVDQKKVEGTG